jgi:hypothetical protein
MSAGILAICSESHATSFVLTDFVELKKQKLEEVFPTLASAFSDARFQMTGFTAASGEWQFIRAESKSICNDDICPTVLIHRATDWKVLVYVQKEIVVSINYEHGESIQCDLKSKDGRLISLRYNLGEKTIAIGQ